MIMLQPDSCEPGNPTVDVVLWDFDGTLVNSAPKNIAITREILATVVPRLAGANLPHWLKNEDDYHTANHLAANWQELYTDFYGLTAEETDAAGALWGRYQASNQSPVEFFDGVINTVTALAGIQQGICSQNSSQNIVKVLEDTGVAQYFHSVIGYEQISFEHSKPEPESGLKCLGNMFSKLESRTIIYVGDHEGDVVFTRNIASRICSSNRLISVAVAYSGGRPEDWKNQPDHIIGHPEELLAIVFP